MKYVLGYKDEKTEEFVCEMFEHYYEAHARYIELNLISRMIYRIIKGPNDN